MKLEEEVEMAREKDRELRRRRHRRWKLKKLREKLKKTEDPKEREKIIAKIKKINPWYEIPELKEAK